MVQPIQPNFTKLFTLAVPLYCPTEDADGNLYCLSTNGDIYKIQDGEMVVDFSTGG